MKRRPFSAQVLSLAFLGGAFGYLAYQYVTVSSQYLYVVLP